MLELMLEDFARSTIIFMIFLFLILFLAVYIYTALALMALAKRLKTKNPWLAWIPLANIYLLTQIAKKEWWWALIIIGFLLIPFIGSFISMLATILMWYFIAKRRKYPEWTCILAAIPLVNLVYIGFLAWGK